MKKIQLTPRGKAESFKSKGRPAGQEVHHEALNKKTPVQVAKGASVDKPKSISLGQKKQRSERNNEGSRGDEPLSESQTKGQERGERE